MVIVIFAVAASHAQWLLKVVTSVVCLVLIFLFGVGPIRIG